MDALLIAAFIGSLLFVGGNVLSVHLHGSRLLTPGFGMGNSMEPAIPGGLTFTIEHYPSSIEVGDVVTYESEKPAERVCHRVVEKAGPFVRIKGDNNSWDDGWFHVDDIDTKIWSPFGEPFWIPLSPRAMRGWIERKRNAKDLSGQDFNRQT